VSLESLVVAFDRGASAEEILESFPTLDLATVYAALAFVLSNRSFVDEYLALRKARVDEIRAEVERRFPAEGLRARLLARRRGAVS
jgi:Fe2+ or Zn2+ uptake regulation protein